MHRLPKSKGFSPIAHREKKWIEKESESVFSSESRDFPTRTLFQFIIFPDELSGWILLIWAAYARGLLGKTQTKLVSKQIFVRFNSKVGRFSRVFDGIFTKFNFNCWWSVFLQVISRLPESCEEWTRSPNPGSKRILQKECSHERWEKVQNPTFFARNSNCWWQIVFLQVISTPRKLSCEESTRSPNSGSKRILQKECSHQRWEKVDRNLL